MSTSADVHLLTGTVENVIYHSEENGFSVFVLRVEEDEVQLSLTQYMSEEEGCITCTGTLPDLYEGERLHIGGRFINHPRYGWQIQITQAQRLRPGSLSGIEKYLASGVIKGIGERTAKRIVARFGADTFDVLANEPERIAGLRGISIKMAHKFSEAFHAQSAQRSAMLFLQEYGISPSMAMRIYKKYKDETVEMIRANPFQLADDIDGIGFKTADAIARRMGCDVNAPERVSAGVRFILWEASGEGHVYLPQGELSRQARAMLGVDAGLVENELVRMQLDRLIIRETAAGEAEPLVFVSALYYAESGVARQLSALVSAHGDTAQTAGGIEVRDIEETGGISLSTGQAEAIAKVMVEGVLVITGGPGTGKTTVINTLIGLLERKGQNVFLAAPTGRAAKRMTEATGREAKTIHRLLEVSFISPDSRRMVFQRNEESPLECDVLIVDEASMMDILLMHSLLKAVAVGTRLILVGDVDQLPSVGAGNVLKDIIQSNAIAVVRLTEIFRQARESAIIMNAHRINQGQYPETNQKEKDFFFVKRNRAEDVAETLVDLVVNRLPAFMPLDSKHDIQVLTPMRKTPLGVARLNALLQERLNPPASNKNERELGATIFREGDKVMQIRNNYDTAWEQLENNRIIDRGTGIYNGDMGIITDIDADGGAMTVLFDDNRRVYYEFSQLDDLELAYAVTVHKSQGSEYKVVVIPVHSGPPMLLSRNLLYTAVTRAKSLAVLVGLPETMHRMVDNNRVAFRYTSLARRLQEMDEIRKMGQIL
ncbi:MAG: ATP-dependent RecD-like DNA helicase [Defluviitaleaceae bacterium]|nr:ATP-dependent RecD-like DNA helicase [Defluviitaleaceae bacterium]MCL2273369.1 ATP-dependent RecD-like DNA helicase [Defluviitaleaceae bacterium]